MILLLLASLAQAAPYQSPFTEPRPVVAATYPGRVDAAPVPHFVVQLPASGAAGAPRSERAQPVVVDGMIFVGSAMGEALYMLDRSSGTPIRGYPASASVQSAPLVVADRVFFADTGGRVWAYTLGGDLLWSYDTAAPVLAPPVLHDGRLFVASVDDLVVALEPDTGRMVWRYKHPVDVTRRAELALYAAPSPVPGGDEVFLGFSDGSVVALGAATGDVEWQQRVGEGRYPDIVGAPTVTDELVVVSGYFEPLIAFNRESHQPVWSLPHGSADRSLVVDAPDGELLVHPGTDGKLRAIELRTGDLRWTWDSGDTGSLTAPVQTDLGLLLGSSTGTLTVIDPATGELTWAYEPGRLLAGLSIEPVVDGRQIVFVTNAGRLHSLLSPRQAASSVGGAGADGATTAGR